MFAWTFFSVPTAYTQWKTIPNVTDGTGTLGLQVPPQKVFGTLQTHPSPTFSEGTWSPRGTVITPCSQDFECGTDEPGP